MLPDGESRLIKINDLNLLHFYQRTSVRYNVTEPEWIKRKSSRKHNIPNWMKAKRHNLLPFNKFA